MRLWLRRSKSQDPHREHIIKPFRCLILACWTVADISRDAIAPIPQRCAHSQGGCLRNGLDMSATITQPLTAISAPLIEVLIPAVAGGERAARVRVPSLRRYSLRHNHGGPERLSRLIKPWPITKRLSSVN